jgi:diguanylate cyclase (GGDEF)-like protein
VSYRFSRFEQLKASGSLPSPTGVALEILRLSSDADATVQQLAHVVQADPALSGRLVKFANSTQHGASRPVAAVGDAVRMLGFAVVRQLALGFSVLSGHLHGPCQEFDYRTYWSRSLATGIAAQAFSARLRALPPEEAFTCGLLGDIGSLTLATLYPEPYGEALVAARGGADLRQAERARLGADHREFTAAMLEDWQLPKICVDGVFHHEEPDGSGFAPDSRQQLVARMLHLARLMGECFVAPDEQRAAATAGLLLRGAGLGLDAEMLGAMADHVAAMWNQWGRLLTVDVKPVPPFRDLVAGANAGPVRRDDPGAFPPPADTPLQVLVVDTDATLREQLASLLAAAGHVVRTAPDAEQGVQQALASEADVILIERDLPGPGGLGLVRSLRASEVGRRVYLVVLSARADEEELAGAFEAGADDCVAKPVRARELLARLLAAQRMVAMQAAAARDQEDMRRCAAELAVANRRLQRAALTDHTTGLPNRRYAMERLEQEWAAAGRHQRPLSVLLVDIDHFRQINERHGHAIGDKLLGELAAVLREAGRASDVLCRFGGEEFLVLCPDTDAAGARRCAERLRAAAEQRQGIEPATRLPVTVSIGVAVREPATRDPESLVRAAEDALSMAKRGGRNRCHGASGRGAQARLR